MNNYLHCKPRKILLHEWIKNVGVVGNGFWFGTSSLYFLILNPAYKALIGLVILNWGNRHHNNPLSTVHSCSQYFANTQISAIMLLLKHQ